MSHCPTPWGVKKKLFGSIRMAVEYLRFFTLHPSLLSFSMNLNEILKQNDSEIWIKSYSTPLHEIFQKRQSLFMLSLQNQMRSLVASVGVYACVCVCVCVCIHTPSIHTNTTVPFFSVFPLQTSPQASGLFSESCVSAWAAAERVAAIPSHFSSESSYTTEGAVRLAEHLQTCKVVIKKKQCVGLWHRQHNSTFWNLQKFAHIVNWGPNSYTNSY